MEEYILLMTVLYLFELFFSYHMKKTVAGSLMSSVKMYNEMVAHFKALSE